MNCLVYLICWLLVGSIFCKSDKQARDILKEIDDYIAAEVKAESADIASKPKKDFHTEKGIELTIEELEKMLTEETKKETQKNFDEEKSKDDLMKKEDEEEKRDFNDAIDIEKEIEALENKEFEEAMDNYDFFHDSGNITKAEESTIDALWKKFTSQKQDEFFDIDGDQKDKESLKRELTSNESSDVPGSCRDLVSTKRCEQMKKRRFCEIYPKEMKKRCRRTCQFCCADSSSASVCKTLSKFSQRVRERTCHSEKFYSILKKSCPKTCEYCGKAPSEPPCVRSKYGCCWEGTIAKDHVGTSRDGCPECKDRSGKEFCSQFRVHCNDKFSKSGRQIRQLCPRTCRRCGPHQICRDEPTLLDSCLQMKHDTDSFGSKPCLDNFHVMKFNCPKTCKICKVSTIECRQTEFGCCPDGTTIAKDFFMNSCKECNDSPDKKTYRCGFWAQHKVCKTHEDFMRKHCGGTCKFCAKK
ncbi:papilin-like [Clytia hemisphaerica]|uniref:ShKT domain-containing protein n=1 Tax=Clytia hemisphaerica TaxID=252671 RepID=A0A7M5WJF2_9CNID